VALIRVDKRGVHKLEFVGNHQNGRGVWEYYYLYNGVKVVCVRMNILQYLGRIADGNYRRDGKLVLDGLRDDDWDGKARPEDVKILSVLLDESPEEDW
jgi:hypothetical protein